MPGNQLCMRGTGRDYSCLHSVQKDSEAAFALLLEDRHEYLETKRPGVKLDHSLSSGTYKC